MEVIFFFLLFIRGFDKRPDTNYFPTAWELSVDLLLQGEVSLPLAIYLFFEFPGEKRSDSYAVLCTLRVSHLGISHRIERTWVLSGAECVSELEMNIFIYCWGTEWSYRNPFHLKEPPLCLYVVLSLFTACQGFYHSSIHPVRDFKRGLSEP